MYTDMHASGGEPARVDRVKDSIPMGRGGQPEEVPGRSYGWQATKPPSSQARSSMSPAVNKQRSAAPGSGNDCVRLMNGPST
ncbi:hypothetical protein [Phyllobacterium endophyticum]|uniref:hypothetical protein n=1 Tax=Phyllobacterium endophyticum TaxID=1149773 RepID=UPI001FE1DB99|nr:hypothetical protein [Phyllobacterium endophyticum]